MIVMRAPLGTSNESSAQATALADIDKLYRFIARRSVGAAAVIIAAIGPSGRARVGLDFRLISETQRSLSEIPAWE